MKEGKGIEFKVWARQALFTDPLSRVGGEKCSYHIPTYEALKGITKSIYWKPTLIWIIDEVRVMKRIRTESKGMKPLKYDKGGNNLAFYTYLVDVEYQVRAHFEWNQHRPELAWDRIGGKHIDIARRMVKRGGRQDIFLGTRECQGYVESCQFGEGESPYDGEGELAFGLMLHGFDYPDEVGENNLHTRFWRPVMRNGHIRFERPESCLVRKYIRDMTPKMFAEEAMGGVEETWAELEGES